MRLVGVVALMGTGAFIILSNLRITRPAASTLAARFDEVRRRFPTRPPLIQVDDALRRRVHVNHPPDSAPLRRLDRFEILAWQAEDEKLVQTRAPVWMMRFSMLNLLSEFAQQVPTTENLCIAIYEIVKRGFRKAHLQKIRIEETMMNSFEYEGENSR